jgi:hypothetical protein
MLKTRVINNDISVNNFIVSEDYTCDRDFYNDKLLNLGIAGTVNGIVDSEIYEYKPETSLELNFNIFFLKYLQEADITQITPYIEFAFSEHVLRTKREFGLVPPETGVDFGISFNNAFENKQENGLREVTVKDELQITKSKAILGLPQPVGDPIGLANIVTPKKSGLPIFYNSFTLPYWSKKDSWVTNSVLYKNKPFFYNSFLLMEFFNSPINISQTRVQSIPIFINTKYNIKEKIVLNNVIHERPCFKLKEGDEGYSFFFLNNYINNEFYVKFSFWDALNGNKILLVPSSKQEKSKKWFQKADGFKNEIRYLKYVLDFESKKYNIFEYDINTNTYSLERTDFDLYELAYDEYFNNNVIENVKPVDVDLTPTPDPLNPLSFRIKNLILDNYQGNKHSVRSYNNTNPLDKFATGTYVLGCGELINSFKNYVVTKPTNLFVNFEKNQYTVPIYNTVINGYSDFLKRITANNIDDITWRIRKLELNNISVITDNNIYNTAYYNEIETNWDEGDKFRVAEALIIPDLSIYSASNVSTYSFSEEMFNTIDFFDILIDELDKYLVKNITTKNFRSTLEGSVLVGGVPTGGAPNYVKIFLDELFDSLKNYNNELDIKVLKFDDYTTTILTDVNGNNLSLEELGSLNSANVNTSPVNFITHSCIYPYLGKIKQAFHSLKTTDYDVYNDIKNKCGLLLHLESLVYEYNVSYDQDGNNPVVTNINAIDRLPNIVITKIGGNLSPSDYPKLLSNRYLYKDNSPSIAQVDVNMFNVLDLDYLNKYIDAPNQSNNVRDYLFDVLLIYNGDNYIQPNEIVNIDLHFSIGNKVFESFYYTEEIRIKGIVKMSLMNDSGDIKNIYIPLNAAIRASKKGITPINNRTQSISPILSGTSGSSGTSGTSGSSGTNTNQITLNTFLAYCYEEYNDHMVRVPTNSYELISIIVYATSPNWTDPNTTIYYDSTFTELFDSNKTSLKNHLPFSSKNQKIYRFENGKAVFEADVDAPC